ncbi:MAG TPA: hypothetical protein VFI29_13570 [Hanamia sp.]|nr:hypothetical protein [Hanamia sp.]
MLEYECTLFHLLFGLRKNERVFIGIEPLPGWCLHNGFYRIMLVLRMFREDTSKGE